MRRDSTFLIYIPVLIFLLIFVSCSGDSSGKKRSRQTAVRVFHAGLDAIPVGLFLGEELIAETRYLSDSAFTPVSPQSSILRLSRSNRFHEPVIEFPVELLPATEYSVFIFGEVKRGTFQVRLLEEPLVIPGSGMSRIQFLHGLIDQGNVRFRIDGMDDIRLGFGEHSGFLQIPSGDHVLRVLDSSGSTISSTALSAPEQGELSILLAGRSTYNFITVKVYEDFD
jgi:hypothetical protein